MSETEMREQCAVGVFDTIESARSAIHILDRAGFASEHISLVSRHLEPGSDVEKELAAGDDSLRDSVVGAALGSAAGLLGDAALLAITGIGTVLVAGPLMIAAGAVVGGLVGAMEGWGVHEAHREKYENLLREGNALVVVDGNPEEVAEADRMLKQTDASEVHLYAQSSDDAPEIDDRD